MEAQHWDVRRAVYSGCRTLAMGPTPWVRDLNTTSLSPLLMANVGQSSVIPDSSL